MHIDISKLVYDLHTLAAESRAVKAILRATWTRPMADDQRRLARIRRQTTELCVLRAFARGRLHVRSAPSGIAVGDPPWDAAAWHSRIASRVAKDYAIVPSMPQMPGETEGSR